MQRTRELATSYTLWSRDRLLGHTELHYARIFPDSRMGDFVPTELGEKLMPTITGISRTVFDLSRHSRQLHGEIAGSTPEADHLDLLRHSTEYADCMAAGDHCAALALELRGPDGALIPTLSIGIQDTEFLLSLASDELEAFDVDGDMDVEWEEASEDRYVAGLELNMPDDPFDDVDDLDADFASLSRESWEEPVFPRFQIQVRLVDASSIP